MVRSWRGKDAQSGSDKQMRKETKKPGSRTSAEDRYRAATETHRECDSYRFVFVCFAGQYITQTMQATSNISHRRCRLSAAGGGLTQGWELSGEAGKEHPRKRTANVTEKDKVEELRERKA